MTLTFIDWAIVAAYFLLSAGMIRRTTKRGDRREYFSVAPETFEQFLADAGRIYRHFRLIAERGLDAMDGRPDADKARLQEFHDMFVFVETEVPTLVERFLRDRQTATRGRKGPS